VIKEKVLERFKFVKNFIDVKNYKGVSKRVFGSRCRVYMTINKTNRIMEESIRPFYGKLAWLVQVLVCFFFLCVLLLV
jgi:hypothetical protein